MHTVSMELSMRTSLWAPPGGLHGEGAGEIERSSWNPHMYKKKKTTTSDYRNPFINNNQFLP